MLITLQELELHRIEVTKVYAPGDLDLGATEFRQVSPLNVTAVAELLGSEVRIQGHLGTRLMAQCDRCLTDVELPLERDFDLFYRPIKAIARQEEVEVPQDELEVGFYSDDGIELAEVATEQVILSLPMKVVCRADCRGLCPICGADRNRAECRCAATHSDSPFALLREQMEQMEQTKR